MKIRNRNKCSVVPLLFGGDTFCRGKISKSVLSLDFQGDKTAQQRLKKLVKGVRILSPRLYFLVGNLDFTEVSHFLCPILFENS